MTQIVLIHGGTSTIPKLEAALPGARVAIVYRKGLSASYDEVSGIAKDYPTLSSLMAEYAPEWSEGEPLVMLGFSAGAWALRYYLRDPDARAAITAAIFLDGLYGAPGGACDLSPYQGVIDFGKEANATGQKRLVMTYSQAHPAPGICSKAIEAACGGGDGVYVRGYANADHGGQQGIAGPEVVQELIAPWIGSAGGSGASFGKLVAYAMLGGVVVYGIRWLWRKR